MSLKSWSLHVTLLPLSHFQSLQCVHLNEFNHVSHLPLHTAYVNASLQCGLVETFYWNEHFMSLLVRYFSNFIWQSGLRFPPIYSSYLISDIHITSLIPSWDKYLKFNHLRLYQHITMIYKVSVLDLHCSPTSILINATLIMRQKGQW